MISLWRA